MSSHLSHLRGAALRFLFSLMLAFAPAASAATTNIFSTGFEAPEYNKDLDLAGQNGWQKSGSGGNGLVTGFFPGEGQQAYLGYDKPTAGDDQLILWKPISYSPVAANTPVVTFSVLMEIVDSTTTTNRDDFYWSVYNMNVDLLFTLNFRNDDLRIYYALDDTNKFVWTGKSFTNGVTYDLLVTMNFASNLWSAALSGVSLVNNKPMTTTNALLNLGDVDAAWVLAVTNRAGDNFMLFDNYSIKAEILPPPSPTLRLIERTPAGNVYLQLEGRDGYRFAIDASTNLSSWTSLWTNAVNNGSFYYLDTSAAAFPRRYYRARWVP